MTERPALDPSGIGEPPPEIGRGSGPSWGDRFDRLLELGLGDVWTWFGPFAPTTGASAARAAGVRWSADHPGYTVETAARLGDGPERHVRIYVRLVSDTRPVLVLDDDDGDDLPPMGTLEDVVTITVPDVLAPTVDPVPPARSRPAVSGRAANGGRLACLYGCGELFSYRSARSAHHLDEHGDEPDPDVA